MTTSMKRTAFITPDPTRPNTTRELSLLFGSVGVICGNEENTVLELEVRADGRWSLVERPHGVRHGILRAEGDVNAPWPECDDGCDLRPGRGGHDADCPSVTGESGWRGLDGRWGHDDG